MVVEWNHWVRIVEDTISMAHDLSFSVTQGGGGGRWRRRREMLIKRLSFPGGRQKGTEPGERWASCWMTFLLFCPETLNALACVKRIANLCWLSMNTLLWFDTWLTVCDDNVTRKWGTTRWWSNNYKDYEKRILLSHSLIKPPNSHLTRLYPQSITRK